MQTCDSDLAKEKNLMSRFSDVTSWWRHHHVTTNTHRIGRWTCTSTWGRCMASRASAMSRLYACVHSPAVNAETPSGGPGPNTGTSLAHPHLKTRNMTWRSDRDKSQSGTYFTTLVPHIWFKQKHAMVCLLTWRSNRDKRPSLLSRILSAPNNQSLRLLTITLSGPLPPQLLVPVMKSNPHPTVGPR